MLLPQATRTHAHARAPPTAPTYPFAMTVDVRVAAASVERPQRRGRKATTEGARLRTSNGSQESAPEYPPETSQELDDAEGADAFETEKSARETRRPNAPERQDEELISLDPPD